MSQIDRWLREQHPDLAVYAGAAAQQGLTQIAQLAALEPNAACAALGVVLPAHVFLLKNGLAFLRTRPSVSEARTTAPDRNAILAPPRPEVAGWRVVRAGYLIKTKWAKGLARSDKRRWVVLRQHPRALAAELEYYEGPKCRGSVSLASARIVVQKPASTFTVSVPGRVYMFSAEHGDEAAAAAWVAAVNVCVAAVAKPASAPVASAPSEPEAFDDSDGTSARTRGAGPVELDGAAIDAARRAALRKLAPAPIEVDIDEEEAAALRAAEEEEERRQEEERLAWLASKQPTATAAEVKGEKDDIVVLMRSRKEQPDRSTRVGTIFEENASRHLEAERLTWLAEHGLTLHQNDGDSSGNDDNDDGNDEYDYEAEMRAAEEAEERRQEEERLAFLASKVQL